MEAWRIRALVYGLLAVVAVLVVAARLEHDAKGEAKPPRVVRFNGQTAQGWRIYVDVQHGWLDSYEVHGIRARCGGRRVRTWQWHGSPWERRATYFLRRNRFDVYDHYGVGSFWMHGDVHGRTITGTVDLKLVPTGETCRSGPIRFTAAR